MSTTTTNYSLVKPALTDPADITAMNPNWDKIDTELKKRAVLGDDGLIDPSQMPDIDVSGKVSKTGDTMTGYLAFNNLNAYHAAHKYRTVNGETYGINLGCGIAGGEGVVAIEVRKGNATDSPLVARLEVGAHGAAYIHDNKRVYLYRNEAVTASVEN